MENVVGHMGWVNCKPCNAEMVCRTKNVLGKDTLLQWAIRENA